MARLKVENEWKEARAIMQDLRLKPRILTFGSWLWASATVRFTKSIWFSFYHLLIR